MLCCLLSLWSCSVLILCSLPRTLPIIASKSTFWTHWRLNLSSHPLFFIYSRFCNLHILVANPIYPVATLSGIEYVQWLFIVLCPQNRTNLRWKRLMRSSCPFALPMLNCFLQSNFKITHSAGLPPLLLEDYSTVLGCVSHHWEVFPDSYLEFSFLCFCSIVHSRVPPGHSKQYVSLF